MLSTRLPHRSLATRALLAISPTMWCVSGSGLGAVAGRDLEKEGNDAVRHSASVRSLSARPRRRAGRVHLAALPPEALDTAVFEARAPDASVWAALAVASVAPGCYWWLVVVPSERRKLAREKRGGGVNEYLEGLEASGKDQRQLEKWFYTDWLRKREDKRERGRRARAAPSDGPPSDALTEAAIVEEDERDPGGADPDFVSLDNPLVATAVLLATIGLFSVLSSR